jgi:hypothetical protein
VTNPAGIRNRQCIARAGKKKPAAALGRGGFSGRVGKRG